MSLVLNTCCAVAGSGNFRALRNPNPVLRDARLAGLPIPEVGGNIPKQGAGRRMLFPTR